MIDYKGPFINTHPPTDPTPFKKTVKINLTKLKLSNVRTLWVKFAYLTNPMEVTQPICLSFPNLIEFKKQWTFKCDLFCWSILPNPFAFKCLILYQWSNSLVVLLVWKPVFAPPLQISWVSDIFSMFKHFKCSLFCFSPTPVLNIWQLSVIKCLNALWFEHPVYPTQCFLQDLLINQPTLRNPPVHTSHCI